MATQFDIAPCDHIAVEQLGPLLGVYGSVASALMGCPLMRPLLENEIRARFEPLPDDLPTGLQRLFVFISMSSSSEREALSRYMSVLINHEAVLCVTSGETLRRILEWCMNDAILDILRGTPLPLFTQLHVISDATQESLELYAAKINAYLINVLPSAYRQRLLARYAVESSPSMLDFPFGVSDRDAFLETALIAYSMFEKQGGELCAE